jgi:hypothetical protein
MKTQLCHCHYRYCYCQQHFYKQQLCYCHYQQQQSYHHQQQLKVQTLGWKTNGYYVFDDYFDDFHVYDYDFEQV